MAVIPRGIRRPRGESYGEITGTIDRRWPHRIGTKSGPVTLTGQLHGTGSTPTVETRLNRAGGVLALSIRCAPASQCTENLRLAVPGSTGTTVRPPAARSS